MESKMNAFPLAKVRLLPGLFLDRFNLNRRYVMSLENRSLLQNHYLEAGLWQARLRETKRNRNFDPAQTLYQIDDIHWGWESPSCELRGHFLGHWLSAAARIYAATGDREAKAKADAIVEELARCQSQNGGEWVASIPQTYLYRIADGKRVWAPHYTIHKTLMGLFDVYTYGENEQALAILVNAAEWFHRWTGEFSREKMDDILEVETGGMLEVWSNLYGVTKKQEHLDLMERYTRGRLFDPLLEGKDVLTNRHANTTIPEVHGAARAYEVTGEQRWREIVEAYWRCAVTDRGYFCTGSQTSGEIWTPPLQWATRLNDTNQEHCVVYNMMRLADFLYRWTGEPVYADYIERNLYNGILAQQHPKTAMIAYFLPLESGAHKTWGSETNDFWCCHGTLVQAHTTHNAYVYYEGEEGLAVCQYVPSELNWEREGVKVTLRQEFTPPRNFHTPYVSEPGDWHRPDMWSIQMSLQCEKPVEFSLSLRLPWWLSDRARVGVNGAPEPVSAEPSSFYTIRRKWGSDRIRIELPKSLTPSPIPDEPGTVAVLDGPVVLAGLCDEERSLTGDPSDPTTFLVPENEREWGYWLHGYRTVGQNSGLFFKPLFEIVDEPYTVYFPVRKKA
jgi:DUF1680 family protein